MSNQPFPIEAMEVILSISNLKSQGILSTKDLATIAADILTSLPPHMRTKQHSETRRILDDMLKDIINEAEVRGRPGENAVPEAVEADGDRASDILASSRPIDSPKEDSGGEKQRRKTKRASGRLYEKGPREAP